MVVAVAGIILCMRLVNERRRYNITSSLIHWAHTLKDPCGCCGCTYSWYEQYCRYYTPRFNEVERGVYWYHLVRLSVCGQNRVRSVSSWILIGSSSYLRILSSNFRRCVACNARFKIKQFEILANFLNLWLWLCLLLTWDPIWLNGIGNH